MDNKNSKSESYVVRKAEQIIEDYVRDRELCDIENYYRLKDKYERLKMLTVSILIVSFITILWNVIFK